MKKLVIPAEVSELTLSLIHILVLRAFYGYECVYHGPGGRFGLIRGRAVAAGTGGLPILGGEIVAERIESL